MPHQTLQKVTAFFLAMSLFWQAANAMPAACVCGTETAPWNKSCCQAETVAVFCCGEDKSCCQNGKCGLADLTTGSGCECGCSDQSKGAPFTPVENSERTLNDVVNVLAISHPAACSVTHSRDFCHAIAAVPCARSGPHAMQALLCIWRT